MKLLSKGATLLASRQALIGLSCGVGLAAIGVLAWFFHHNPIFASFVSFVISLIRSGTVVLLAWFTLRFFDRSSHLTFYQWSSRVDDKYHQIAMGLYFGMRCLAVFLAFAIGMA
ncbi:hypothetical protein [Celerinatantimonas diazotrophica]|uniref:Uncharacterized protein n=1 Tax=Celerinatantimonas diazotrophica TaxID=412034 RepID=A0A4R1K4A1_9GAMM|nr:hypothetical protein [Celerinatantimonas diazotrophica]TCK58955.1 hypothetical protein EV690_1114 [Celerinatantimonas diazotrophica]CAG9297589.1 hypothetical protein CEDIAZO_02777 [Celerinatantimonas diazotrophica]